MQRRASSRYGAGNAAVGQTSRQARHEPQWSSSRASAGMSSVVKMAPKKSHDPCWRETRLVCLPCQPSPAAAASGFSITAAVSTKIFASQPLASTSARAMRLSLDRSEEHTSELQSQFHLVCRLLLEKKNLPTSAPRLVA